MSPLPFPNVHKIFSYDFNLIRPVPILLYFSVKTSDILHPSWFFSAPKLAIPRSAMEGVRNCIKATPFGSGVKRDPLSTSRLRAEREMKQMDDDDNEKTSPGGLRCLSPPLFPRKAETVHRATPRKTLKEALAPITVDVDMTALESEEDSIMEQMRIAEGWRASPLLFFPLFSFFFSLSLSPSLSFLASNPRVLATIPLDLGPSSTPPLTTRSGVSSRTEAEAEDEDEGEEVLQIDELMLPSSPPFSNKELKELFRTRMGKTSSTPKIYFPLLKLQSPPFLPPSTHFMF